MRFICEAKKKNIQVSGRSESATSFALRSASVPVAAAFSLNGDRWRSIFLEVVLEVVLVVLVRLVEVR